MSTKDTARRWNELLAPYYGPDRRRSIVQLTITASAFISLWLAAFWSLRVGYWLTLLLALPTAGFLMRLFMIQHDCGHGSFFKSQKVANAVGFVIGVSFCFDLRDAFGFLRPIVRGELDPLTGELTMK